jgi:hypothetical protein
MAVPDRLRAEASRPLRCHLVRMGAYSTVKVHAGECVAGTVNWATRSLGRRPGTVVVLIGTARAGGVWIGRAGLECLALTGLLGAQAVRLEPPGSARGRTGGERLKWVDWRASGASCPDQDNDARRDGAVGRSARGGQGGAVVACGPREWVALRQRCDSV